MFGLFTMIFVSQEHFLKFKKVETCYVKTGAKGMAANKGSTAIKFWFGDTSFVVMNCHLAHGENSCSERFDDLNTCHNQTLQQLLQNESKKVARQGYDQVFLAGDFNFRVELPYEQAVRLANELDFKILAEYD